MICFRVTRNCNARCRFCLAPPNNTHAEYAELIRRIKWLLDHQVKTIHFCGGEPSVHPDIEKLISFVHKNKGKSKITTNGIRLNDSLISTIKRAGTEMKISLHGDRIHHNDIVGVDAYDMTTANIKRVVKANIPVSIQSTIVAGNLMMIDKISDFCLKSGIRRLSILPFIPRGKGDKVRHSFELSSSERRQLKEIIKKLRRKFSPRLDIRRLDFNTKAIHVVEPDGKIILEGISERSDRIIYEI